MTSSSPPPPPSPLHATLPAAPSATPGHAISARSGLVRSVVEAAAPQRLRDFRSLIKRMLLLYVLLWGTMWLAGCNIIAWGAQAFRNDDKPVPVEAEYLGMPGKRIAVLVAADEQTLYRFPGSPFRVSEAVSRSIATHLPDTAVTLPAEIRDFQRDNPYWLTSIPDRLIDQLGVDRLVIIDLSEYRTNEAGNVNVWRGTVAGTLSVYEADSEDPNNRAYEKSLRIEYPDDSELGLINDNVNRDTIEAAMLEVFGLKAAGLFYDHEEVPGGR